MLYTWGYIKTAALAKLDLDESGDGYVVTNGEYEATAQNFISRFPIYANEAMTQICSAIKPKYTFAKFEIGVDKVGVEQTMPDDFISFGDDQNYQLLEETWRGEIKLKRKPIYDDDILYQGYNKIVFTHPGTFYISYNARWFDFQGTDGPIDNFTEIDVPKDILDCIPSYIAAQCYKVDDQYKSAVFYNEYEMFLARIDNTHYKTNTDFRIEGDW